MKNVIFSLLQKDFISDRLTIIEQLACNLVSKKWRQGKRALIACENNTQAFRLDEEPWMCGPPCAFIPHNLTREGQNTYGTPIEIS